MAKKNPVQDESSTETSSAEESRTTATESIPGSSHSRVSDTLPGRQLEMAALLALVQRALMPTVRGGDGPDASEELRESHGSLSTIACVQGGGGTGKSRLLAEVRAFALRREIRVKEVFCHERQGIPFLPVLRVVKELIAESSERQRLWQKYGAVLSRVFPEIAAELGVIPGGAGLLGDDGKIQLFDALTGMLSEISRERPLLILIHDLHRSDPGTVDFIEFLGRNVFLDDIAQRREAASAAVDGEEESWKEIGSRLPKSRESITDGLVAGGLIDMEGPATRLMVVANYLAGPAEAEEVVAESGGDGGRKSRSGSVDPAPAPADPVDDQLDHELRVVAHIDALCEEPFVTRVSLEGLSKSDVASLAGQVLDMEEVPESLADRIHEVAAGNPLASVELCRGLQDAATSGVLGDKETWDAAVVDIILADAGFESSATPGSGALMRQLVLKRLESLDDTCRSIVEALAALRRPVQIKLLEGLLGGGKEKVDRDEIRRALVQLEGREFVKVLPIERSPLFFLVHDDYTRCIYSSLDVERRRELHHRIGSVLAKHKRAKNPVRAFEIHEHFRCSTTPRECIPYGLRAATYFAAAFALDAAAEIENHLLELLAADDDLPQRLDLLRHLSEVELERGEYGTSKHHAKKILELGEGQLTDEKRLDCLIHLSEVYRAGGEPIKGIKTLNRATKHCADIIDERAGARISGLLGRMRLERQDPKRAINICMRGLKQLESVEDADTVRIDLLQTLADAHLAKRETVAAIHHYQRLLELVESVGDEPRMASVLSTLGRVYYDRGNYFRAARYLFRALDVVRRRQDVRALSRAYDALGKVYRNSGDNLRGLEYFNRSLRLRERIGDYEGLSPTLNSLGSLYAHMGNYYDAIRYFKRSVENSERFGDTAGIVRAFLHLARAYHATGELRQVESLCKQILILSQEFNYSELEGEGHRLQGNLRFLRGDHKGAERRYRKAIEISSRRGRPTSEAAATLDLGELLYEKEEYEAALKLISKGQRIAEEIQSTPLQARAFLLKGNVHRFLKGGNLERAKEALRKGLELVAGENHLPFMWELDYSIAKVFQANREFVEAGESYRRAQRILERIAERLPEDMKVVYHDDRRRKVFYEDLRRFEKEASGRAASPAAELPGVAKEERVFRLPSKATAVEEGDSQNDRKLIDALKRLGGCATAADWGSRFLDEARRLVPSPQGCLVRSAARNLEVLAATDMGPEDEWLGEDRLQGLSLRQVIRRGEPMRSGDEAEEALADAAQGSGHRNRSFLALPLVFKGEVLGALYLERPSAGNLFEPGDQELLERLANVSLSHFKALDRVRELEFFRATSIRSTTAFEEQLSDLSRDHLKHGEPFALIEAFLPGLDQRLAATDTEDGDSALSERITALAGDGARFCAHVGEDAVVYGFQGDAVTTVDDLEQTLKDELPRLLEAGELSADGVQIRVIRPIERAASAEDLARTVRGEVYRRLGEFSIDSEIESLTTGDLSLKEAKTTLEKRYITAELLKSRGNITRAAEALGVHRPQLSNLIKKHNVRREDFE